MIYLILGVIIGLLIALSTFILSIHLDQRNVNVVSYISKSIKGREKGHIINNNDKAVDRLVDTFAESENLNE